MMNKSNVNLGIFFGLSFLFSLIIRSSLKAEEITIIINPDNGNKYFLSPEMSWESAQEWAKKIGGNLVTVNDEKENQWLVETFIKPETKFLWIGINDIEKEGNFIWISDEKSDYFNWADGEPNNNIEQGGEHFGALNGVANPFNRPVGTWSDAPAHAKLQGIVEISKDRQI
ncbi:C-type lectin domain-containing protein [Geminocystis sp. NIES-3709]|uniref:C-type lectin domain-containing protein n=1 Tax=Geminocystis sp. NIES-3709 TaxID=1617448 RepID=UPI0005FC3E9A|nr:C-type lectin domain-containing protein [Geminocystis sp. NIES-3709]BAQ64424.1 cell surface protein [Geminocystis sp. NIES-3709]